MLETNEELNRKFAAVIRKLSTHDKYFRVVFDELRKLTETPTSSGGRSDSKRTLDRISRHSHKPGEEREDGDDES
jgi:hypothetical protein